MTKSIWGMAAGYALGTLITAANAATTGNVYNAALGVGDTQCQSWSSERQQGGIRADVDREWVLGFISGMNLNQNAEAILKDEASSVVFQLDEYCSTHPKANVMSVTTGLVSKIYAERIRVLKTALPTK
jgi:uncharacterized protein YgfB (UPF0149 family)